MKKYKKGDSEYQSNGHYIIDGQEYLSIKTFKEEYSIEPNYETVNAIEGTKLVQDGCDCFDSKPDEGKLDSVKIYFLDDLMKFYSI